MRFAPSIVIFVLVALLMVSARLGADWSTRVEAAPPGSEPPSVGVAVVELFTSQGCSSCPPAERLLAELNTAVAGKRHRPVYTLAFHVDYWDHLGWRDPFSSAAYSTRQMDYARTLHLDQAYTPQMIVNGDVEFVGSDRAKAASTIANALAMPVKTTITLSLKSDADHRIYQAHYVASPVGAGQVINFAVVEQGLSTKVEGGENAGRSLDQPSVVRWFKTVPANNDGHVEFKIPEGAKPENLTLLAYIQRVGGGAISGAAALPVR